MAQESKEDKKLITRALEGVTLYLDATSPSRQERLEDFKFVAGDQWSAADKAKLVHERRPLLTFNMTSPVVNSVSGYQEDREQDYRAYPRGSEDEHLGRICTSLMKYAMDNCRGLHTLHKGFRQGITCGQAVFEVSHSYGYTDDLLEGDVNIELLEHDTWGHEIGARRYDRNDATYMYKLVFMDIDSATRRWKSKEQELRKGFRKDWLKEDPLLTGVPTQLLDTFIDEEKDRIRILQYWYRVNVEIALLVNSMTGEVMRFESTKEAELELRKIYDLAGATAASQYEIMTANSQTALIHGPTGSAMTFQTPNAAQEALDKVRKQAGEEAANTFEMITRPTTALRIAHLTPWVLLDDKPREKPDWRYPFIPFTVYQDTDNLNDIKGLVRDIKDPQREINWHHATALDVLQRGPKGGVWVPKGEHADIRKIREEYSKPGFVGEYVGQPPIPVLPAQVGQGEADMLQFGLESIMRISGINAEMMGQGTQKTVSGRAIMSRQAGGISGLGSVFMNWKETKTLIGGALLRCIQYYYTPEKMDRIIGDAQRKLPAIGLAAPETAPPEVMYEKFKTIKDIDLDVVVEFQDSAPTARMAEAAQAMQLMAMGIPVPPQLLVEITDPPYKTEILAALANQGQQSPNPELAKVLSAGQGQAPNGVNTTQ